MTALASTVAAYVLVGALLWGYAGVLLVQIWKGRRRED